MFPTLGGPQVSLGTSRLVPSCVPRSTSTSLQEMGCGFGRPSTSDSQLTGESIAHGVVDGLDVTVVAVHRTRRGRSDARTRPCREGRIGDADLGFPRGRNRYVDCSLDPAVSPCRSRWLLDGRSVLNPFAKASVTRSVVAQYHVGAQEQHFGMSLPCNHPLRKSTSALFNVRTETQYVDPSVRGYFPSDIARRFRTKDPR